MVLTQEEERLLKLIAAEVKAKVKLNIANKTMGDLIRAEFNVIDTRIRAEHKPIYEPLQAKVKTAQDNIKKEFE